MRNPEVCGCLFVLVVLLAIPAVSSGAQGDATPPVGQRPCLMVVDADLKPFADLAWEHSPTFREQCRRLGAGRAAVIVRSVSSRETLRADSRITVSENGAILARIRVKPGANVLEFLGHELEHVVERLEGVNLLMESQRGGSGVALVGGAYETRRAIEAGIRVAGEVDQGRRTMSKTR
jgi:hypothetical protein